jgi:NosR/NirI family nitrous oxide reductase transcriptional regulator
MLIRLLQWCIAVLLFQTGVVCAQSYEAQLPPELTSSPDMCAYAPCREVMPGADSFSERKGRPPYVEAYRTEAGKKIPLGYVFLSTDIVDIPAYSGKPVITLIGMDLQGKFTGVRILKHSEPILLLGIPEDALTNFNNQYLGKFVGDYIEIGHYRRLQPLCRCLEHLQHPDGWLLRRDVKKGYFNSWQT